MPHSSGGGSSGGGFHGGSGYHGSGSSSSSNYRPTYSRRYFPGAFCYVYYDRHHYPHTIYSSKEIGGYRPRFPSWLTYALLVLLLLGPIGLMLFTGFHNPKKLSTKYDTTIVIDDHADFLSDSEEQSLNITFQSFLDTTGITPAFISVSKETEHIYDLENYAYNQYVKKFDDEKHWLIVYAAYDDGRADWEFEGMQGNDTDTILPEKVGNKFNKTFVAGLNSGDSISIALNGAFDTITPHIMDQYYELDESMWIVIVVWAGLGTLMLVSTILNNVREYHLKDAVKVDKEPELKKCPYCDSPYYVGTIKKCPNCGAVLSEEDDFNTSESEISEF